MRWNLFSDENWEVAIFLVDLGAESDKTQQIDAETHAPHNQLPVAEIIQKRTVVLQQLDNAVTLLQSREINNR